MTSSQARFYKDILDESGMSLYANSFQTKNQSPMFKRTLNIPRDNVSQSVKQLGRKTFEPEETLFSRRDMPDTVRRIKEDIDRSKDPDILERHKARWNSSVDASKQSDKDITSIRAAMHKVRSGEYKLPALPMKERSPDLPHQDIGRDRGKYMGWQYGIEHTSEFMRKQIVDQITETSQALNRKMFDGRQSDGYRSPFQKTIERNDEIREMKKDSSRFKIEKTYKHDNPFVSPEKLNAGIFKELDNYHRSLKLSQKIKSHPIIDTESPFLIPSPKKTGKLHCYHTGSWGQSPTSHGRDVWSCCMNESNDSQGCTKIPVRSVRWDTRPMFPH